MSRKQTLIEMKEKNQASRFDIISPLNKYNFALSRTESPISIDKPKKQSD